MAGINPHGSGILRKAADYFGKYYNVDWYNDTFFYKNKKHTYEEVYPAYMY